MSFGKFVAREDFGDHVICPRLRELYSRHERHAGICASAKFLEMEEFARGRPTSLKIVGPGLKLTNNLSLPLIDFDVLECVGCIVDMTAAMVDPPTRQRLLIRTLLQDDPKLIELYDGDDGESSHQGAGQVPKQPERR